MSSSDTYYNINILNNAVLFVYKYVLPVVYVLTNVGNLLIALIFSKKTWRKNVCVFYFKIYLFFNTCYINSTVFASILNFGYNLNLQNSNVVLCKVFFYVAFLFALLPPTILILASIDRLLISSQNVDTRLYSSKRLAYFLISLGTCFCVVFNFHILIKVSIQELYPSVFVCYYDPSKSYLDFVSYYLAIINISYSLIMIILCSLSFKNIRHIQIVPRQQRSQVRSMTKKDFQLLRCLFAHGIVYIVFCLGINIYYGYEAVTRNQMATQLQQAIETFLNNLFTLLFDLSYSTSFFIYVVISKAFRHELKRLVYNMFGKVLMPIREEENRQENLELNVVIVSNVVVLS